MNAQPAFELKSLAAVPALLQMWRRIQTQMASPSTHFYLWKSRRIRSTMTARQLQSRVCARPVVRDRYVCLDVCPAAIRVQRQMTG